jgi:hypothetical protein
LTDHEDMFFVVASEPAAPYIILRLTAASLGMSALFRRATLIIIHGLNDLSNSCSDAIAGCPLALDDTVPQEGKRGFPTFPELLQNLTYPIVYFPSLTLIG